MGLPKGNEHLLSGLGECTHPSCFRLGSAEANLRLEGGSHAAAFKVGLTLDGNTCYDVELEVYTVVLPNGKEDFVLSRLRENTRPSCLRFGSTGADRDLARPTPTRQHATPRQPASSRIRIDGISFCPPLTATIIDIYDELYGVSRVRFLLS